MYQTPFDEDDESNQTEAIGSSTTIRVGWHKKTVNVYEKGSFSIENLQMVGSGHDE